MNVKEIEQVFKGFCEYVTPNLKDMPLEDQIMYLQALDKFTRDIKPLVDKYDPTRAKKFVIKRLDEYEN